MRHADRKQATREALIASATAEIRDAGIAGLSVRRITQKAGFTQGAFYPNFKTLNALLGEVLERQMRSRLGQIITVLSSGAPAAEVVNRLRAWLRSMQDDPDGTLVMLELQLHALRDREFGETYNRLRAEQHRLIAEALDKLRASHGLHTKLPPMLMSLGFSALWSGFALQGRIDNGVQADDLIGAFMDALIGF